MSQTVDVGKLVDTSTDQFRLETLPQYLVPDEDAEFSAWKRGERTRDTPETSSWLAELRELTAAGVHRWRVHILDYPLAEYSKYELFVYQSLVEAGEKVYIANRSWHSDLADLHDDFWIFDQATVVQMVYDSEGRILRRELVEDAEPYFAMRDTARLHAIPLSDYLHKYEPDLIA